MQKKYYFYKNKEREYFNSLRIEIIDLFPEGKNKVLEIGCANGLTLLKLKELNKAEEIVGIDIVKPARNYLDAFIHGDIEEINLPYEKEYFDVIICADVLEHLINPWGTLNKLLYYLKGNGYIIASIPTIRNIAILTKIFLFGNFEYTSYGILDQSHLRFFCKKNILELFQNSRLTIEEVKSNLDWPVTIRRKILKIFNLITLNIFKEFLTTQYIIRARKTSK